MKRILQLAVVLSLVVGSGACINIGAIHGTGPGGGIFTQTKIGTYGGTLNSEERLVTGESCIQRIYVFAVFGGDTVPEIAREYRIAEIRTVDRSMFNILGLYSRMCTIVRGVPAQ